MNTEHETPHQLSIPLAHSYNFFQSKNEVLIAKILYLHL